jgi:UDPglucose 6-dehydrogenase
MRNQDRIVLGGDSSSVSLVKEFYSYIFPNVKIIETDASSAEMVKYITNCFLAMKVSFANEIYQICNVLNINFEKTIQSAIFDKRLGDSHWNVPGPDGSFGYGGHCFPKDINALISLFEKNNIKPTMLKAAWEKNLEVRHSDHRDWEKMEGRAVSRSKK